MLNTDIVDYQDNPALFIKSMRIMAAVLRKAGT